MTIMEEGLCLVAADLGKRKASLFAIETAGWRRSRIEAHRRAYRAAIEGGVQTVAEKCSVDPTAAIAAGLHAFDTCLAELEGAA